MPSQNGRSSAPGEPATAFTALSQTDPYPLYAQLRNQNPIEHITLPNGQPVWAVMGYEAVQAVLKDSRFGKDVRRRRSGGKIMQLLLARPPFRNLTQNMLRLDPPDHTRLRALVFKAFTPRRVEQLAPRIQAIADGLLDAVYDQGQMDLITAYASPLAVITIAELLGVPVEDRAQLGPWSNAIIKLSGDMAFGTDTSIKGLIQLARRLTARRKNQVSVIQTMKLFSAYLEKLIETRRSAPQDDLVSALIEAKEQNDALSKDELLSMLLLLFMAGHETTVHLIGNGILALLLHPEQLARLQREPALIKSAIEEFLRYNGPLLAVPRFALEDVELKGQLIRKDEAVMVVLAAANHDPAHVARPDDLDITRSPGQHLGFGSGIHYCVGAPLARLEGQIAINTLLRRLPNIRLAIPPESLAWQTGRLQRGVLALPVSF